MKRRILVASLFIALALGERLFFDLGPNVELVTMAALLSAVYLGFPYAFLVPFIVMVVSDVVLGNTAIFVFTWSAYLVIGGSGLVLRRLEFKGLKLVGAAGVQALASSLFFYLWTNFGVWWQGWYPPTLAGLVQSYWWGLPFLKFNLIGNLLLVPSAFALGELITFRHSVRQLADRNLQRDPEPSSG